MYINSRSDASLVVIRSVACWHGNNSHLKSSRNEKGKSFVLQKLGLFTSDTSNNSWKCQPPSHPAVSLAL